MAGSPAQHPPADPASIQAKSAKPTSPKVSSAADGTDEASRNIDGVDDVGYGKPPRQHRFKPGEINSPNGRRGKSRASDDQTLLEVILAELGQSIKVTEGSKSKHMRKITAFGKKLVSGALKGETPATRHLISLLSNQALRSAIGGSLQPRERELTMADEDIIEQFRQRCIEEHKLGTPAK